MVLEQRKSFMQKSGTKRSLFRLRLIHFHAMLDVVLIVCLVIYFATKVERQFNTTILTIRSDNSTEFKNYSLNEFLSDAGIKHHYSAAYTPQQNGIAERKNGARTMLVEFKSPYNFWAEAINTARHATNRLYLHKNFFLRLPMRSLLAESPTSCTSECLVISVSISRKVFIC
jgi:hypothetical protein